jgi:hypothetical protein
VQCVFGAPNEPPFPPVRAKRNLPRIPIPSATAFRSLTGPLHWNTAWSRIKLAPLCGVEGFTWLSMKQELAAQGYFKKQTPCNQAPKASQQITIPSSSSSSPSSSPSSSSSHLLFREPCRSILHHASLVSVRIDVPTSIIIKKGVKSFPKWLGQISSSARSRQRKDLPLFSL